jgi:hypothetical protein
MARESLNLFTVPMSVQQAQEMEKQAYLDRIAKGGEEASFAQSERLMNNIKSKLFGYESPEIQRARQMEQAMSGIQYDDPASLDAARKAISAISPESGMAFDQYLLNRMATQREIQAKDLEMALKAQEAVNAAGGLPENAMTDTMANQVAGDLVNRGIITEDQAPMIAAQIQYEGKAKGGSITDILTRMGFGQQPTDAYGGVSTTGVAAPTQPQQGSSQKGGVAPRMR